MCRDHCRRVVCAVLLGAVASLAAGAGWPMQQRDMGHTGRASYTVPAERLNSTFFDVFLWQTPTPDGPGDVGGTSMTFMDGVAPDDRDLVVGTYHWPKGIQGMDRHTGETFWQGNPGGGETIGEITPAFANHGYTVYVVNDATDSGSYPDGHPLMAFDTWGGPLSYFWHNGDMAQPRHFEKGSPTIGPGDRIFLHDWCGRAYGAYDDGLVIDEVWAAGTHNDMCLNDISLFDWGGWVSVVAGGRGRYVRAWDGDFEAEMWSAYVDVEMDAAATIDPDTGSIYGPAGADDIYVVGLDADGFALWSSPAVQVYDYQDGVNNPQRAQATGCLSHDGATFYFQTNSSQGDGALYAINTADGSVKWTYPTGSTGWEVVSSSPIVTPNGVIVVGNNEGDTYYALQDTGSAALLLDTLVVDSGGNARASATLSDEGVLYLPLRVPWSAGNGNGDTPDFSVHNLFAALDLSAGASVILYPPGGQAAFAGNAQVSLIWLPLVGAGGQFDHFAVYRDTAPFTSVAGMTPLDTVGDPCATAYVDGTAQNGVSYYYAVTVVSVGGGEVTDIAAVGPRTPFDETDLQMVSIARAPLYPRYCANYTWYEVTEPSGFGPYGFTASTSLCGGQTLSDPRWPDPCQPVTYTATVRNRGTNPIAGQITGTWRLDGAVVLTDAHTVSLAPGDVETFEYTWPWDDQAHDLSFTLETPDDRGDNNILVSNTKAVGFLTYIDRSFLEAFRENTPLSYPGAATDDLIDWLNRHLDRFNAMFDDAGCPKRVHYSVLSVLDDAASDPAVATINYAIFPFRYRAGDGDPRLSGYYRGGDDIDYGLLHEMGHQLGLIDIYQLDVPADWNEVSGLPYSAVPGLMHGVSEFLSAHSALAMTAWQDEAHGYFGQYLYNLPQTIRLRVLGLDGQPLPGATVKMYQYCERPGVGKRITNQVKAQGVTDGAGLFTLPNVPVDPGMVPPVGTGDVLQDNPFGYVAVVGTNGVLHFRIEYDGGIDYAWLDITEANVAYWQGQTAAATFERQVNLGGATLHTMPGDLTELNADDWYAWAEGSAPGATYVADDAGRTVAGAASVKFVTDGPFDTLVRYPRTYTGQWDLTAATTFSLSVYAENANFSFQNGSPWIRLRDGQDNYFEYQYYQNGGVFEVLNGALGQWQALQVPLAGAPDPDNGWRRTAHGTPDLADIRAVEIHADTWGDSFTLWFDAMGFDLPAPAYADLHYDRVIDLRDVAVVGQVWLADSVSFAESGGADMSLDHQVDWQDLPPLVDNWLATW